MTPEEAWDQKTPTTPEEALEVLSARLLWKMEHLDPSEEEITWPGISDFQRDFYRILVGDLLRYPEWLELAAVMP